MSFEKGLKIPNFQFFSISEVKIETPVLHHATDYHGLLNIRLQFNSVKRIWHLLGKLSLK